MSEAGMDEALIAEFVTFTGHGGDPIRSYEARPLGPGPFPGVIVVHHMPGWDPATFEITRTFAAHGYSATCPNLFHRHGPDLSPDDAAAASRAAGGVPDDQFVGDAAAALERLRTLPSASGKVGIIGYCSGGRQAFLAACVLPLDAAIDCYGGFVAEASPADMPSPRQPVLERAAGIACPILGLFGADDQHPSLAEVEKTDAELTRLGKPHEFHTFEDAGHAFFTVDRPAYRVVAAVEGWRLVFDFFERTLRA